MGNWDIFIAILPSSLRSDRSHSSGKIVVSATRSINTPKSLWQVKELWNFPLLSPFKFITWKMILYSAVGEMSIKKHFARQEDFSGLGFLYVMNLHPSMTLKKLRKIYLLILTSLAPNTVSFISYTTLCWWKLIKVQNFVMELTE